jgi:chromosome segregation ATPase
MSISLISALMALIPAARIKKRDELEVENAALKRSNAEMLEHIRETEVEVVRLRAERNALRAERDLLIAGSHVCQHQAQLNRALARLDGQIAQAYQQAQHQQANMLNYHQGLANDQAAGQRALHQQAAHYQEGLLQRGLQALNDQAQACHLRLDDCNMHRVERSIGRPN